MKHPAVQAPRFRGSHGTILLARSVLLSLFTLCLPLAGRAAALSLVDFNVNLNLGGQPAPVGALNPPALLTYTETDTDATFSLAGSGFSSDSNLTFGIIGAFWKGTFQVNQDAGTINDGLTVSGTFQHIVSPAGHADKPFGGIFAFNLIVDADKAIGGAVSAATPLTIRSHLPKHEDQFTAQLQAAVSSSAFLDDITGWTFTLEAHHLGPSDPHFVPIPEPGSIAVGCALIGFCGLAGAARYRRRASRLR
ncbi:hypothetical protein [Opitutus terrae]|nr:hypothetical protein [Opitutus terrae]